MSYPRKKYAQAVMTKIEKHHNAALPMLVPS